jgi:hypothetical protein
MPFISARRAKASSRKACLEEGMTQRAEKAVQGFAFHMGPGFDQKD